MIDEVVKAKDAGVPHDAIRNSEGFLEDFPPVGLSFGNRALALDRGQDWAMDNDHEADSSWMTEDSDR